MASDNEATCESDPNFAVICAFLEKFGITCGLAAIDFLALQEMLENTQEVPQELIDLHIKLLRKSRKTVSNERWEKAVIKFCHTFSVQDAWEIERFGYKKARLSSKLRVLKELLEMQFDYNVKFKSEINKMSAEELRSQPLGKDKHGHAYWFQNDNNCQVRVYKEDPDEETWTLVVKDRDGLASLINDLSDGDSKISSESNMNEEDSNSLAEKPIIDTGQVDTSNSFDSSKKSTEETDNSNGLKKDNISIEESDENARMEHFEESDPQKSKRARESDYDELKSDLKKSKIIEPEVSEAVEEPLMLVKGAGLGTDNEGVNPIIGEEIEEDVLYFYGCGNGLDCQTGNEDKPEEEAKSSKESRDGPSSIRGANLSSGDSVDGSSRDVPTFHVKSPFKLGTIIDTKTDNKILSSVKSPTKKSRWDVETIIAKDTSNPGEVAELGKVKDLVNRWEQMGEDVKPVAANKPLFFFGPGCLQRKPNVSPVSFSATIGFGQKVPQVNLESKTIQQNQEANADVGYRISSEEKTVEEAPPVETEQNEIEIKPDIIITAANSDPIDNIKNKLNSNTIDNDIASKNDKIASQLEMEIVDGNIPEATATKSDNIPAVTAALVHYEESDSENTNEVEMKDFSIPLENDDSKTDDKTEPVPVVEEICVQRRSYTLGNELVDTNLSIAEPVKSSVDPEKSAENTEVVSSVLEAPGDSLVKSDLCETFNVDNVENCKNVVIEIKCPSKSPDILEPVIVNEDELESSEKVDGKLSTHLFTKCTSSNQDHTSKEDSEKTIKISEKTVEEVSSEVSDFKIESGKTTKSTKVGEVFDEFQISLKEPEIGVKNCECPKESGKLTEDVPISSDKPNTGQIQKEVEEIKETLSSSEKLQVQKSTKQNLIPTEADLSKETITDSKLSYGALSKDEPTFKSLSPIESKDLTADASSNLVQNEKIPIKADYTNCIDRSNKKAETIFNKTAHEIEPEIESKTSQPDLIEDSSEIKVSSLFEETVSEEVEEPSKLDEQAEEVSALVKLKDNPKEIIPNENIERTNEIAEILPDTDLSVVNKDKISVNPMIIEKSEPKSLKEKEILKEETSLPINVEQVAANRKEVEDKLTKLLPSEEFKNFKSKEEKVSIEEDSSRENNEGEPLVIAKQNNKQPVEEMTTKSRKNNISEEKIEDKPRITTRRSTRSSKNEEHADIKPELIHHTKDDTILVVKCEEVPTIEDEIKKESQPRRGRSRAASKTEKENCEGDISKKMKLSTESVAVVDNNIADKEHEVKSDIITVSSPKSIDTTGPETDSVILADSNDNSNLNADAEEQDPLAVSEEEDEIKEIADAEKPSMSLSTFSLDFTESPTPTPQLIRRNLRKRGRESLTVADEVDASAEKRIKIRGRRSVDVQLRKSIEEAKKQELISSDDETRKAVSEKAKAPVKRKGKRRGRHRRSAPIKTSPVESATPTAAASSEGEDEAEGEADTKGSKKKSQKKGSKKSRLLSNLGIDPEQVEIDSAAPVGVRQSRRIAQLKIREEAERRKLEEEYAKEQETKRKKSKKTEDKDYKSEKKKVQQQSDEDEGDNGSSDSKQKKKRKKKRKLFDELNPWRSSSDSSSNVEEDEEEIVEEETDEEIQYLSDHEFSPESDLEKDGDYQPLKRARTARKESDVEEEVDDCPCQKCGKSDHPEWILLCDRCDNGWHCSCLRPPLLVIPEGDWFCPPCQHALLLQNLEEKLKEYDKMLSKKELEDRRKQRLAYVGISLNSVLPTKDTENIKKRHRIRKGKKTDDDDGDEEDDDEEDIDEEEDEDGSGSEESESESGSGSASKSDSDEPIYQLRQRRQAHSYRFNDYDELINSAIQDEMEAVKGAGNQGRGKDIATIVNAEKEEERKKELEVAPGETEEQDVKKADAEPEPLPPVVPPSPKEEKVVYSDDEPIRPVKKLIGRKKHRKLNSLDISSADDEDSDEDFKGTTSESEDDFDEDLGSEDSEDLGTSRRRRNLDPVRRSTRARVSRYDADFIDDGDSEDEDDAPKKKKKRSIWDESESEESDRSWGRKKRRQASRPKKAPTTTAKKKKSKKKKKQNDDSDAEVYRKKKPKIKFGLSDDDDGPVRRTRGKKINYVDALGSDSDEDRGKRPPPRIESEEEYVANEEDDVDEDDKATDEEEVDSPDENATTAPKIQIQSYADARYTQALPENVPAKFARNQEEDVDDDVNPIDEINKNLENMDANEMEKMMDSEEYANKQLHLVALQIEKEKRRKEREAKKLELETMPEMIPLVAQQPQLIAQQITVQPQNTPKKRGRKPKNQFQFTGAIQEPIVGNVDNLINVNSENNDELSEPPGVSLPMFGDLGGGNGIEDPSKKRRGRNKKSLEEAVANLGGRQEPATFMGTPGKPHLGDIPGSNIEIAAPPLPFSQSQPTPSVITRMLQNKPGQPGYPVGTIRPKQFAAMTDREEALTNLPASPGPPLSHHAMSPGPPGQYMQGSGIRIQMSSPYRQLPPNITHFPRGTPPPQQHPPIRNPVPHIYHGHRPMDPSPSGGGPVSIPPDLANSPGRVVSPASSSPSSNKNETPPPPYSRPPVTRFPIVSSPGGAPPRHLHMVAPHLQPPRPNMSPYHSNIPPSYHYGQFGQPPMGEDAMPPTVYQNSPYSEQFGEAQINPSENSSNSKTFDEESGGEFGGLVSYFSSQREDDLES